MMTLTSCALYFSRPESLAPMVTARLASVCLVRVRVRVKVRVGVRLGIGLGRVGFR